MSEKKLEHRLEDIRRSCLNCGHLHYNHAPCCDNPNCVSDLMREMVNRKKQLENANNKNRIFKKLLEATQQCTNGGSNLGFVLKNIKKVLEHSKKYEG